MNTDTRWTDAAIIIFGIALGSLWAAAQFGQAIPPNLVPISQETANVAFVYFGLAVLTLIIMLGSGKFAFFRFIGLNVGGIPLAINIGMGAVLGFLSTTSANLNLALAPVVKGTASIDPALNVVYVNFLAPLSEEYAFRGAIFPSIEMFFHARGQVGILGTAAAAIISSLSFVVFHLVAYQANPSALLPLFIFAMLECVLVKLTNSLAPAIGSHFILNLINAK